MDIGTFIKMAAICLAPAALWGQISTSTQRTMVITTDSMADMGSFLRRLANNPPASLALLDTSEKDWEKEFERVRSEDPYAILNLHFIPLTVDKGVGAELREREGWPEQMPRWALFDAKGRILAEGGMLPTSAQLADECSRAGVISKAESLRRFLRENPGHEEAREKLLQELRVVADKRTRFALQQPESQLASTQVYEEIDGVTTSSPNDGGPTAKQLESLPPLDSDADERIWREYCAELHRYLDGVVWQSGGNAPSRGVSFGADPAALSSWAVFSPAAKAAYAKAAAAVEAALQRQPSSPELWRMWLTMHKTGAGKSLKDLLANLRPSPSVAAADWPPSSIRAAYIAACRETGDWKAIQELVEPIWESVISRSSILSSLPAGAMAVTMEAVSRGGQSGAPLNLRQSDLTSLTQSFWVSSAEPYLEALLKMQRLSQAEQLMKSWAAGSGWPGAFSAAAAIADRLGFEATAKAWREMGSAK
jgi:hypothetical protein